MLKRMLRHMEKDRRLQYLAGQLGQERCMLGCARTVFQAPRRNSQWNEATPPRTRQGSLERKQRVVLCIVCLIQSSWKGLVIVLPSNPRAQLKLQLFSKSKGLQAYDHL